MSKEYDYAAAKKMIQIRSDLIESATLGMAEDWGWTCETVYEDSKFTVDLDEEGLKIAGISGSFWATPSLALKYKDGREELIDCFTGESTSEEPEWFSLGCISEQTQEWVEQVKRPKLENKE